MFPTDLLLLDIIVILAAARMFGALSQKLGQPAVIGEIVAGIALGPTLLGQVIGHRLFPAEVVPSLTTVADIGLVLYMFVVGMELDKELVQGRLRVAGGVAAGTTALPLLLGWGVAIWLAPRYAPGGKLAFVLFFAVFGVGNRVPGARAHPHRQGPGADAAGRALPGRCRGHRCRLLRLAGRGGGDSLRRRP
jgi:Kef-type K+ transport system membrane component KefB